MSDGGRGSPGEHAAGSPGERGASRKRPGLTATVWHAAVATVLAACRREAGLSQDDLALRLGWHRTRIAKIESGGRRVDVPEFIAVANALNIPPPQLLARVLNWLVSSAVVGGVGRPRLW
jgi:DNA-binding XRE family transcriptional regulator